VEGAVTRVADFGVFVQIEGLVEGLMHMSETPFPRGEKPQDHFKEGDAVAARILRIEDPEMKVALSSLNQEEAAAAPAATPRPPEAEAAAAPETEPAQEKPPVKKKRTRKKAEDASPKT